MASSESILSGELPGGYRLCRYLGRGSFATVYEGLGPDGERVAVKVLTSERKKALRRFEREIKVLRALPLDDHVVGYRGHGVTASGRAFLVMELVEGQSLADLARSRRTMAEPDACRLVNQLCDALAGLHKLGVTHGDIKPSNIMVQPDGMVKLLDFGLVRDAQGLLRLFEEDGILEGSEFSENIDRGVLIGTPAYLSPEQIGDAGLDDWSRRRTDTPSDVYSIGVILYELLSGRLPYPFELDREARAWEDLADYLKARLSLTDEELVSLDECSPELWTIVRKALRQDPKKRQGDARLLRADIERYQETGAGIPEDADDAETFFVDSARVAAIARGERAANEAPKPAPPPEPVPLQALAPPRPVSRPAMRTLAARRASAGRHRPETPRHSPAAQPLEVWPLIVLTIAGLIALGFIAAALLWPA